MKKLCVILSAVVALMAIDSCNSGPRNSAEQTDTTTKAAPSKDFAAPAEPGIDEEGGIPIFYNMYLSVELSSLFKHIDAVYNPKLSNSPDKTENYNTSSSKALNFGVYAVDLSYSKFFDQIDQAAKYLQAMHTLSSDLGIPDDKFIGALKRVESNLSNKDSLIKIANELYKSIEDHLKVSERENTAALVIVGGWVEAMYIATSMVNDKSKDIEFLQRIEDQKNSIKNLTTLLEKYQKDPVVKEYLNILKDLHASFLPLHVQPDNMGNAFKQLNVVKTKIAAVRKKIVG